MVCSRMAGACAAAMVWLAATLTGCGLDGGFVPLPARLPPEEQARIDYGWRHFAAQAGSVEREALLQVLLFRGLWHNGVDRAYFEVQKYVGETTVTMTVDYDRTAPAEEDALRVVFSDAAGNVLRAEVFTRAEMEGVLRNCVAVLNEPVEGMSAKELAALEARQAELAARAARVAALFPAPPEDGAAAAEEELVEEGEWVENPEE